MNVNFFYRSHHYSNITCEKIRDGLRSIIPTAEVEIWRNANELPRVMVARETIENIDIAEDYINKLTLV